MSKITARHKNLKKVTNEAESNVRPKSLQHSSSSKLSGIEKTTTMQHDLKGHIIADLIAIAIVSIPVILVMIVIYIFSNMFFP